MNEPWAVPAGLAPMRLYERTRGWGNPKSTGPYTGSDAADWWDACDAAIESLDEVNPLTDAMVRWLEFEMYARYTSKDTPWRDNIAALAQRSGVDWRWAAELATARAMGFYAAGRRT